MDRRKIVVLATGGTIAGTAASRSDNVGYTAATLGIAELLDGIESLEELALVTEQVAQIDSKDMDNGVWTLLARRCAHWLAQDDVQGIVVTHGTDTLEETAWLLQALLAPAKPVVLTCAMRPATALSPDGPQNLVDAVAVARWPGARGVVAACAGVVHGARDVRKVHPYRVDAFSSGDAGPIAHVEEGRLRLLREWPAGPGSSRPLPLPQEGLEWPWVEIVTSHGGAGPRMVDVLVAAGVRGIVVAGSGNGSIQHKLEAALRAAQAAGVRVVQASRCEEGVIVGRAGGPFESCDGLSPVKARLSLQLQLMAAGPAR